MLYHVGILIVLLNCICAGVCLSSLVILTICHTFNLALVEFNIDNELQELNTSINSSLPWLIRRTTSLAIGTVNSIKSSLSRVSLKSKPNYAKIIAQKDQELAQLRKAIAHQAARIELLETRNAAVPLADQRIAQQTTEIAEKDARISSLINKTVRQAAVEARLRKKLANEKAKVEDQEAEIAVISGDISCLEDQVKNLEGEKNMAFATAKAEGATAEVQEVREAHAAAEEGRKEAQDRLVEYEELLENAAFDVREMQSKLAESKKIDPHIHRQTVQQVRSLHAERDDARVARYTATKEMVEAKIVESEAIKSMTVLLEELKSAIKDKEHTESKLSDLKCNLDKDVKNAEDKVRIWENKFSDKVKNIAKIQRASSEKEAELRNEIIRADVKSHSKEATARTRAQSLENQLETLQATNESLEKQLQRFKNQARHTRNAKQLVDEQAQAQESSGKSKEELQAYIHTLSTRVQDLENTAEKDKQILHTSLQTKIDELQKSNAELRQRPMPSAVITSHDTGPNLQEELDKQRTELEGACRRILADKDSDTHRRVDAVIQERNMMEERLRNEMVESESNLKELANKLWDEKKANLDMEIQQANNTITNLRADFEKLEEQKKIAIDSAETDYEYLRLDIDRLNEEISDLKQAANDNTPTVDTADSEKTSTNEDSAMNGTSDTTPVLCQPPASGQPSSAASQLSVPFTFGASAGTVPATQPLYSGTAAGKKPANDLFSFDVAGNALANNPSLFRVTAGNQPADNPFSIGAIAGNQPADNPFSIGAIAGNQLAGSPFSIGAIAGNQPAGSPLSIGAIAGNQPAGSPLSIGAIAGNQPAGSPFSIGAIAGNQLADKPFLFGTIAGNQPADKPFLFGALAKEIPANDFLPLAAPIEDRKANEQLSFGSLVRGTQVDQSKPPSAQQPAPTPANSTGKSSSPMNLNTPAQPSAPVDTTHCGKPSTPANSSPSTQPLKSASPTSTATTSTATAISTPLSILDKKSTKSTPATPAVAAAQAGGKAIALAAATKIKADQAAARESKRASELREEVARNTPNEYADQLLGQLQGANETLAKILNVVKNDKRMARVEAIHSLLCTCPVLNEKAFVDIDKNEWPVLHKQLEDTQSVYDELDMILEDFQQLRWEDLHALLTKPRGSDPVEDTRMMDRSAPVPAEEVVALPGLYPDGDVPVRPRVIKPLPRIRRGPNKINVVFED